MTTPKIEWRNTGMTWRVSYDTPNRHYAGRIALGLDGLWIGTLTETGGRKGRVVKSYMGKTLSEVQSMIDAVLTARGIHL